VHREQAPEAQFFDPTSPFELAGLLTSTLAMSPLMVAPDPSLVGDRIRCFARDFANAVHLAAKNYSI